jgi:hypothetical protein
MSDVQSSQTELNARYTQTLPKANDRSSPRQQAQAAQKPNAERDEYTFFYPTSRETKNHGALRSTSQVAKPIPEAVHKRIRRPARPSATCTPTSLPVPISYFAHLFGSVRIVFVEPHARNRDVEVWIHGLFRWRRGNAVGCCWIEDRGVCRRRKVHFVVWSFGVGCVCIRAGGLGAGS